MPSANLRYNKLQSSSGINQSLRENVISTPLGLVLLEIQGELNLPSSVPSTSDSDNEQIENFFRVDDTNVAVKFGKLEIDENDPTNAVLYVGKSQKLQGSVKELDIPLAVMRVPNKNSDLHDIDANGKDIDIVDIIRKKVIFKNRPLPIM